jgi:hypothetical protein
LKSLFGDVRISRWVITHALEVGRFC